MIVPETEHKTRTAQTVSKKKDTGLEWLGWRLEREDAENLTETVCMDDNERVFQPTRFTHEHNHITANVSTTVSICNIYW